MPWTSAERRNQALAIFESRPARALEATEKALEKFEQVTGRADIFERFEAILLPPAKGEDATAVQKIATALAEAYPEDPEMQAKLLEEFKASLRQRRLNEATEG